VKTSDAMDIGFGQEAAPLAHQRGGLLTDASRTSPIFFVS
jgi:hypothetical protein